MKTLLIILAAIFGLSLISYGFFWYETANGSALQRLQASSHGHPVRWVWRGILSGALAQLLLLLALPLALWRRLWVPRPGAPGPRPAVILIHGIYHNASAWLFLRHLVRRAGFSHVFAWSYRSWETSFERLVDQLETRIREEIHGPFPEHPLILIGHSMGGLLTRALLTRPQVARRVRAVVTLGTPHQGSKLAVLGVGRLARSLHYRGPLISRLEALEGPLATPALALYSPVDNMVLPHQALHPLQPGWTLKETAPVSHVALLYHPGTARHLLNFLQAVCTQKPPGTPPQKSAARAAPFGFTVKNR
jgi:pimeloyl-ACP methyl ester carboxylesterase